jgi:hypothetical protein
MNYWDTERQDCFSEGWIHDVDFVTLVLVNESIAGDLDHNKPPIDLCHHVVYAMAVVDFLDTIVLLG